MGVSLQASVPTSEIKNLNKNSIDLTKHVYNFDSQFLIIQIPIILLQACSQCLSGLFLKEFNVGAVTISILFQMFVMLLQKYFLMS